MKYYPEAYKRLIKNVHLKRKLKKLKGFAFDVDGVLTDSRVFWTGKGFVRSYSVKDGYGIILLQRAGFHVGIISAGKSSDVKLRLEYLEVKNIYLGVEKKEKQFEKFKKKTGLSNSEIGYIGDDLFDIPVLKLAGFSATVPEGVEMVKKNVDYVTSSFGGFGAAREIIEAILIIHGKYPKIEK